MILAGITVVQRVGLTRHYRAPAVGAAIVQFRAVSCTHGHEREPPFQTEVRKIVRGEAHAAILSDIDSGLGSAAIERCQLSQHCGQHPIRIARSSHVGDEPPFKSGE